MNGKMPVSALQELMAARQHPLPVYIEEGFGTSFKCTVRVEGISAVGYGTTKKVAKHESAKQALAKLQAPDLQVVKFSPSVPKPLKNYVGELNEFSSQRGIGYPDYEFVTATVSGQFIFKCSFLGKEVQGVGMNKKDAKQDAARNMLELIRSEKSVLVESRHQILRQKYVPELTDTDTSLVIEMFNKLSTSTNGLRESTVICMKPDPNIVVDNGEDSLEELEKKLKNYKIDYVIKDFQKNPYVVTLIIKDTNFTFFATGNCKTDALKKVYKDVLEVKRSGCSFTADLTSFK